MPCIPRECKSKNHLIHHRNRKMGKKPNYFNKYKKLI